MSNKFFITLIIYVIKFSSLHSQDSCTCKDVNYNRIYKEIIYNHTIYINKDKFENGQTFYYDTFLVSLGSISTIIDQDTFNIFSVSGFNRKDTFKMVDKHQYPSLAWKNVLWLVPDTSFEARKITVYRFKVFLLKSKGGILISKPIEQYDTYDFIIGYGFMRWGGIYKKINLSAYVKNCMSNKLAKKMAKKYKKMLS